MMIIEIAAGIVYGSMALLADGWHMGTHAAALGITVFAYFFARRHADDPNYSFGTGKVGSLGGYTSAVVLAIVAILMFIECIDRLLSPIQIRFNEAIFVAFLGLLVNLASAFLLKKRPHSHGHDTHHHHGHHDHNLQAAYLHVLADAVTSFLALIALFAGKALGWVWMDPAMGIVGSIIIGWWAFGLLRDSGAILLDSGTNQKILSDIRSVIEADSDNNVADLHVWRVGSDHLAAIISIVTHHPQSTEHYKKLLCDFKELSHITVEINQCNDEKCRDIAPG